MLKLIAFVDFLIICSAVAKTVEEEQMTFRVNGIEHFESRKVADDIVILTDMQDQFVVTLDYGRNILLINNLKTQTCFLTRLEDVPINKEDHTPVLVVDVNDESDLSTKEENMDVVMFSPAGIIPFDYFLLTNDADVAKQCDSKQTAWLELQGASRRRRDEDCGAVCGVVIFVLGGLLFG